VKGKLGAEFSVEQGYQHARSVGLALLAVMKAELGSLDRVKRVVKLLGMVNGRRSSPTSPRVINGCSDLSQVFGDKGKHARSAVGMDRLPNGIPVEIEASSRSAALPHGEKNRPKKSVGEAVSGGHGARGRLIPFVRAKLGPRSLEELKQETIRRAERNMGPLGGSRPRTRVERWRPGQPSTRRMGGGMEPHRRAPPAAGDYYQPGTASTSRAGERAAFARQAARLRARPRGVPAAREDRSSRRSRRCASRSRERDRRLLALPANAPAGAARVRHQRLDSRKEEVIAQADAYLKSGVGVFAVDMPRHGPAPILVDVGAERMFSRALDYLQAGRRSTRSASSCRTQLERVLGGGHGVHREGPPARRGGARRRHPRVLLAGVAEKGFSTREYLFDVYPRRASVYARSPWRSSSPTGRACRSSRAACSRRPSAPMLLVNGERGHQQPIADLYLLMKHGDPKDVWVNPRAATWAARALARRQGALVFPNASQVRRQRRARRAETTAPSRPRRIGGGDDADPIILRDAEHARERSMISTSFSLPGPERCERPSSASDKAAGTSRGAWRRGRRKSTDWPGAGSVSYRLSRAVTPNGGENKDRTLCTERGTVNAAPVDWVCRPKKPTPAGEAGVAI